jgi:hypothetical protein
MRVLLRSPVREFRTPGSARGLSGNRQSYLHGNMTRALLFIVFFFAQHLCNATEYDESIEGGRSPDRQFEVINKHDGEGGYFVIRNNSVETIFSEKSLRNEFGFAYAAWNVVWRSDSRFVAIAFSTTKFCVETIVFRRDGQKLTRVQIPEYDPPEAENNLDDNTHRIPHRWLKNGDLVLDITTGYHTKSDGGITGYYATIRFAGNPPRGTKHSRTKSTDRD